MEDTKDKNIEYLTKDLKFLGFPEAVQQILVETLQQVDKAEKIALMHNATYNKAQGGKDEVRYTIDFNKSDKSDRYFLNSYTATLKNEADPTANTSQKFFIDKGAGVTAKEAYNLLSGRPVHKKLTSKDDQKYEAWMQLDFTNKEPNGNFKINSFHKNYGYDLPEVLSKYPIKELNDVTQKKDLIQSLEKGNVRSVTFAKESGEEKMFVVANPQYKNLLVYDSGMKQQRLGVERREQEPDQKKDKKESVKQDNDDEESQKSSKKSNRKRVKV